jgi:adenosylmethionine-8-amino-7-oxononanoate aminotransferase
MSDGEITDTALLSEQARRHLWMHFTRLSSYADHEVPIIVRGEGPYVWDQHGRRYLDGLSGLFTVQAGHGRVELAEAAARQAARLAYFPIWSYAHPTAVELATRLADLAPGDINRVFFTSGGSEAVESAWKLARQYFRAIGEPMRTKIVSRNIAYHGTSMGALSITGIPELRMPFEPLVPGALKAANTDRYRCRYCAAAPACTLACADDIEDVIVREGPATVAAVIVEPVQNAGGCYTPPDGYFARLREICDRYGILLVSDEVICAFGRLGHMFGCQKYDYLPDIITCAKGLTSGYSPLGAMLCRDFLAEPFLEGAASFTHGFTFAGHPVSCAVALANLDVFEKEDLCGHVRSHEAELRGRLESLRDLPIVGEVRGTGFFYGIELVKDQETKAGFTDEESEWLLRGFLSARLFESGLICRADDRGDPVIQLAPTLVCGPQQFEEIETVLRAVLSAAWDRVTA